MGAVWRLEDGIGQKAVEMNVRRIRESHGIDVNGGFSKARMECSSRKACYCGRACTSRGGWMDWQQHRLSQRPPILMPSVARNASKISLAARSAQAARNLLLRLVSAQNTGMASKQVHGNSASRMASISTFSTQKCASLETTN